MRFRFGSGFSFGKLREFPKCMSQIMPHQFDISRNLYSTLYSLAGLPLAETGWTMSKKGLLQRLADGESILCAEGYLLEFERRGYLQAGGYFPEIVLESPEVVRQLHEEFVHAGSDVIVAFTFYGHRKKMRDLGREADLEKLNRDALRIAKEVADAHGCLFAGNICNTGMFLPEDYDQIKAIFEEQVQWSKEAGVDYIVAETFKSLDEASLALEVCKKADIPIAITFSPHTSDKTFDGVYIPDACRQLEEKGAAVVGLNCGRGPKTMISLAKETAKACKGPVAVLPVAFRTTEKVISWEGLTNPDDGSFSYPENMQCHQCTRAEIRKFATEAREAGIRYIGLCCGNSSYYFREMAEAYGREPPASKYRPCLKHSLYFKDESTMCAQTKKMKQYILGDN